MNANKLTPNLVVENVERSVRFYEETLGFAREILVPEQPPFVFGSVRQGSVEIFFNERDAAAAEYPAFTERPLGGSFTMFIEVDGLDELLARVQARNLPLAMPLKEQFYGMREFAIADPDGYLITIAERTQKR
jgi:catechol 2,3-dioxygenase-like lactoylglutathione lyase family enzyme